jgi:signal transduction histidine kinase
LHHDLDLSYKLLKQKEKDYTSYSFKNKEIMAICAFYDLAQEFTSMHNLYRIAVAVMRFFFNHESCIYTARAEDKALEMRCCTSEGLLQPPKVARPDIIINQSPYRSGQSFIFPIIGKRISENKIPLFLDNQILGMLEIFPMKRMTAHKYLFYQKYANRIGYNMHNKIVFNQNIEHIRFINQLVADIEHNVITPNIYYKAFILHMRKNLQHYFSGLEDIDTSLSEVHNQQNSPLKDTIAKQIRSLHDIHHDMEDKVKEFENRFNHLSLFLETLFRGEHFKTGGYVLKRRSCNLLKDVFLPELDYYRKRFKDKKIEIIRPSRLPSDEDLTLFVDLGLTAQVFSNLLSNALKYCKPVLSKTGKYKRYISYRVQPISRQPDDDNDIPNEIKFTLFSTGNPLTNKEALRIFEDGYRSSSNITTDGEGHGLYFVHNIAHIQGGRAGCEPKKNGNDFYIILPKKNSGFNFNPVQ